MFNWIRSTGVRESRRHEIRLWRWTQAKYWLLTDTLAIVTKLSWWSMIIFPLSQWWSKNSDGLFRLSWRLLITPGLIAWTHLCPNMQIYPRFKINTNTRMQDLKERNICSQLWKTEKYSIDIKKSRPLELLSRCWLKDQGWSPKPEYNASCGSQDQDWEALIAPLISPLGQGMSASWTLDIVTKQYRFKIFLD